MNPIGEQERDEGSEAAAVERMQRNLLDQTILPKAPRKALARYEFSVPGFVPVNLNDSTGRHWSVKDKARKNAAEVIAAAARIAGVPHVSWTRPQVRRVRMAFAGWPGGRMMPDPDNLMKYQLDALTTAFLIVDDSEEWLEWEKPVLTRSDNPTCLIVLEDLEYKPGHFKTEEQLPQMVRLLKGVFRKMGVSVKTTGKPENMFTAGIRDTIAKPSSKAARKFAKRVAAKYHKRKGK